ncbi:MAG: CBS domain-containing protein [Planctomycetales bacterium]|nr:CBS domain-containing protein [Planctomycetales bacterium]
MGTVNEILSQKQARPLLSARPDETVLAATQRMNEHGVGAILVMDAGRMVGIFTERDVLRRVVAEERLPSTVLVSEVMTSKVACCTPETSIEDAQNLMRQFRIRHVPVVNADGDVQGVLSIGDLNAYLASKQEVAIHFLQEYLHGRT